MANSEPSAAAEGDVAAADVQTAPPGAVRLTAALLLAAAAGLAVPGCAGPERSEAPVSEEVYVEVMARLAAVRAAADSSRAGILSPRREADTVGPGAPPQAGPDPEGGSATLEPESADSLREAILREHEVRREDLKAFARIVGDEPKRMESLWTQIAARTDSLREAGWPPAEPDSARGPAP